MTGAARPFERLQARLRPPRAEEDPATPRGYAGPEGRGETAPKTSTNGSEEWRRPQPTDLIFPKWQRELFRTILDEEDLRFDREGRPRTAYSLRHTYICLRLMEGADIYQIAKNCRTSVEMIEKYYAAHIRPTSMPPSSTSCGQSQRKKGKFRFAACMIDSSKSPAMRAWRNGRR
jgi:integrase